MNSSVDENTIHHNYYMIHLSHEPDSFLRAGFDFLVSELRLIRINIKSLWHITYIRIYIHMCVCPRFG